MHISDQTSKSKHWALFFVSVQAKKIFYVDPKGPDENTLKKISKTFMEFSKSVDFLKNISFSIVPLVHQIQNDSFNCGVYICHFFEVLLNAKQVDKQFNNINKSIDINLYRQTILGRITEKSKITVCCLCHHKESPKLKTQNKFLKLFTPKLEIYKCKHSFHVNCYNEKVCFICENFKKLS